MGCGTPGRLPIANGLALATYEWGAGPGPPVILLHSLAAHSHWWDWVAPHLARRRRVVAIDFRGHGASDHAHHYRFDDYVDDVLAVAEALGIGRPGGGGGAGPLLIGHSMGGYVAALLTCRHPDRVGAVVIVDMLTGWDDEMDRRARAQAERASSTYASADEAGRRFRLAPPETTAPAERLQHLGAVGVVERAGGRWEAAFDRCVFLHPAPDPWPFLGAVRRPALVVRGAGSPVMPRAAAERVATSVPRGELLEIPDAFHHVILDAPEAFADGVQAWETRVSTGR